MQLVNSFTIARPADEVYHAFLQVDRIATCMPGSTLLGQPVPGTYEGEVKVKVGPLSMTYTGEFVMVSTDDDARRLEMRAKGREVRGAGSAEARIVATMSEVEGRTTVQMDTDLDIRGKVAQFGRGVISEVTDGIMQTFAKNVEAMLVSDAQGSGSSTTPGRAEPSGTPRTGGSSTRAPFSPAPAPAAATEASDGAGLDAMSLIVLPILRRIGPGAATIGLAGVAAWLGARAGARSAQRSAQRWAYETRPRRPLS